MIGPDEVRAIQAKALVVEAFRNGPLEDIHSGRLCEQCYGQPDISHITQEEMKSLMKHAVNVVYAMLEMWERQPEEFGALTWRIHQAYATDWDDPEPYDLRLTPHH